MRHVQSSNISAYEHDPETGVLTIQFNNGRLYTYEVPEVVAAGFEATVDAGESVGRFFSQNIRNHFPATEITED